MENRNDSTLEEQKVLEKYVAASLKAYPILLQFCKDLNEAVGDMRTDEEKERHRKDMDELRRDQENYKQKKINEAYTAGYAQCKKDYESSKYFFFTVGEGLDAVSCSLKKQMSYGEFRARLADWERVANAGRIV